MVDLAHPAGQPVGGVVTALTLFVLGTALYAVVGARVTNTRDE